MSKMGRWIPVSILLVLLATVIVRAESENKSIYVGPWSSVAEEGDLLTWKEDGGDELTDQHEHQLDGGFSSLDGMLQWAIGHSDPAKLKQAVKNIESWSPEEVMQRQIEIKELMEKLKTPSDAQLMKIAIDDLNNLSSSLEERHRALQELLILVEPIDNANDLHKLGGITAVIKELYHPNPEIRTTSAWILGKASQNNPTVREQILDLGALTKLIEMVGSNFIDEATKALYAISALIRNNIEGQELFYREGGELMLQNLLSNSSADIRLLRKSVFLLADLAEHYFDNRKNVETTFFGSHLLLKSLVDLIASPDLDLQEKILYALKNLLSLKPTNALVLEELCEFDLVLVKMNQQFQQLMVDEESKEYLLDLESLRSEVELIFRRKLDEATRVPT